MCAIIIWALFCKLTLLQLLDCPNIFTILRDLQNDVCIRFCNNGLVQIYR